MLECRGNPSSSTHTLKPPSTRRNSATRSHKPTVHLQRIGAASEPKAGRPLKRKCVVGRAQPKAEFYMFHFITSLCKRYSKRAQSPKPKLSKPTGSATHASRRLEKDTCGDLHLQYATRHSASTRPSPSHQVAVPDHRNPRFAGAHNTFEPPPKPTFFFTFMNRCRRASSLY
ncbi:hypothetical protein YC2023_085577 [Brassica napus]